MNPFFRNTLASSVAKGLVLSGLALTASITALAEKVTVTVKGTVSAGGDMYGIFGVGKDIGGKPFTLTFTFDDARAHKGDAPCADAASVFNGSNPSSPAAAVLTIGHGSFTFGNLPNSTWSAHRDVDSTCGPDALFLSLNEGTYPQVEGFQFKLISVPGKPWATKSIDWHSPLHATDFDSGQNSQSFIIVHPGDFTRLTQGVLVVESVTVQ